MLPSKIQVKLLTPFLSAIVFAHTSNITAQDLPTTDENSTVTYPASYFDQYEPFSVSDMLDRIPGITVARQGAGGPGGSRRAAA